ncbi:MAG TPA: DDE-type integrase/transposase/recombinase [Sphingomicrobium sp.]
MCMQVNSEMRYLWRAVDHEGEILESFVTKLATRRLRSPS